MDTAPKVITKKKKTDEKSVNKIEEEKQKSLEEIRYVFQRQQEEFAEKQRLELEKILEKVAAGSANPKPPEEIVIDGDKEDTLSGGGR